MRLKRFLQRAALAVIIGLAAFAGIFWFNISADEAEVLLPTLRATAVFASARTNTNDASVVTATPTPTTQNEEDPLSTFTPIPTITNTPPPGATNTPTQTRTPRPTLTPSPTGTPTSVPQGSVGITTFLPTEPTLVPAATPVERIEMPSGVTNILLIGSDAPAEDESELTVRTDSLIVVSVNREQKTASMLSIPRDLYLYIPGWTNARINSAYAHGNAVKYPGGGVQLLKDTILYNFGIPIHYYARIDFDGFEETIDTLGGIEIINSCELRDWRLIEPGLDIYEEDNYIMHTLEPGVHEMDGFMALWYARSRRSTSDFDRGRRQQQILRAVLNRAVDLNMVSEIPSLWDAYQETVDTDMDIGKALQLATAANTVRDSGIQHLYLTLGEIEPYIVPETGASVQLLNPEQARKTFSRLYQPPELNRASRVPIVVEIVNGTGDPDMALLAADNLRWQGFEPTISVADGPEEEITSLTYTGENWKGSYNWLVGWLFSLERSQIDLETNDTADYNYRVILGADYNPCRNPLYAPRPGIEPDA